MPKFSKFGTGWSPGRSGPVSQKHCATQVVPTAGLAFGPTTVFHFTDADPDSHPSDYVATVVIGDATLTSMANPDNVQIVANPNGGFDVQLCYTCPEELSGATFGVTVQAVGAAAAVSAGTNEFNVQDAALTARDLTPPVATQGIAFGWTTVFHFTDADPNGRLSDYVATVVTGDATLTSADDPGNVRIVADPNGGFDVQLSYTYTEGVNGAMFSATVVDKGGAVAYSGTNAFTVCHASYSNAETDVTSPGVAQQEGSPTGPLTSRVDGNDAIVAVSSATIHLDDTTGANSVIVGGGSSTIDSLAPSDTLSLPAGGTVVDAGTLTLSGTSPGEQVMKVNGGGTACDAEVGGLTGSGTAVAAIPVVMVHDAAGNPNTGSTSSTQPIVMKAERQLATVSGFQVLAATAGMKVQAVDLPGGVLGEVVGKTILIDRDTACDGWFVDPTPAADVAFAEVLGPYALAADNSSPATNRVDLLTTVMHEMGRALGYEHGAGDDLMNATLPLGVQRFLAEGVTHGLGLAADNRSDNRSADISTVDGRGSLVGSSVFFHLIRRLPSHGTRSESGSLCPVLSPSIGNCLRMPDSCL